MSSVPRELKPTTTCPVKSRLGKDLSAVVETVSSLESHLNKPQTLRDFVHPECLRFELQRAEERKNALLQEYDQHLTVHGC
jgi:hypothetical protein